MNLVGKFLFRLPQLGGRECRPSLLLFERARVIASTEESSSSREFFGTVRYGDCGYVWLLAFAWKSTAQR